MPRGMDERFEDPSADSDEAEDETEPETTDERTATEADSDHASRKESDNQTESVSENATTEDSDEPLNIRDDWDSATIYVEPEQSEDIEVTFTRLKKQLKREGYILEKNKHFYRAVFEIAFDDHREETKERIRELVKQDMETRSKST